MAPKYLTGDHAAIDSFINQFELASLGIPSNPEEVFTSAYSSAVYIAGFLDASVRRNKVFVLGEAGIETELRSKGIQFIGGTDPSYRRDITAEDYKLIADGSLLDDTVGVVLVGLDLHINYLKLAIAYQYLIRGSIFLATNTDSTYPSNKTLFPGAGSISKPLVNMFNIPPIALGKPSQEMMDAIEGNFKLDRQKTCMVGDRLDTDIKFGIEGKLGGTLLVLTGVSKKGDWEHNDAAAIPAFYVDKLSDLRG
ncbi:hypothetical protein EPUL_002754 [Erysiphe pulchra]|uniref:4-nitrophenylphosphatase n=1 Tax=Erysiphe pulchra TaxID=225359 RepID=A0A2S4PZG7_9PEZI|nr:hypothetical protein EPUL_002754 [Erysiphe pulchra]